MRTLIFVLLAALLLPTPSALSQSNPSGIPTMEDYIRSGGYQAATRESSQRMLETTRAREQQLEQSNRDAALLNSIDNLADEQRQMRQQMEQRQQQQVWRESQRQMEQQRQQNQQPWRLRK